MRSPHHDYGRTEDALIDAGNLLNLVHQGINIITPPDLLGCLGSVFKP
jgi:hypothetical protein